MTSVATQAPLYHSPRGLIPFQVEHVARAYLMGDALVTWSTGLGKTHLGMALAALLLEDDEIDHALFVVEKTKVRDWIEDLATFTEIEAVRYHGQSPKKRASLREALPQAIVSTYETVKGDAVRFQANKKKDPLPGPLCEALEGKRVLVVYDEATKLKNRTTDNYRAHEKMLKVLRQWGARVVAMTATPLERGPEDIFNIVRLVSPGTIPTVAEFERCHVLMRDIYDRATYKNLDRETLADTNITPLDERLAPVILSKRKTDPDVAEHFPEAVEEFWSIPLATRQGEFYDMLVDIFGSDDALDAQLFMLLRQVCAHPMSLLRSNGALAQAVVSEVGESGLRALGSAKTDRLLELFDTLVREEREKAIVFSFFGPSVIPILAEELRTQGYRVVQHHGGVSNATREQAITEFKHGDAQVFLSSDAGARGLNLPEAAYVVQLDIPFTHSLWEQRGNRHNRFGSERKFTLNLGMIAEDTIEDGIIDTVWHRNEMSDRVLGDVGADGMTAEARRMLLERERNRRRR